MRSCMFYNVAGSCSRIRSIALIMLMVSLVLDTNSSSYRRLVQGLPFPAPDFRNCNNSQGCCPPPYNKTFENFYVFDTTLPMRSRRPAHLLDDAYIAKYQKAYQLLRALPDSDGRSWKNQANLHCAYCNAAFYFPMAKSRLEIHYGWLFFPWHRFFLYFHERILAQLVGDDTFAIPFWNWDDQSANPPLANVLPDVFANAMFKNKSSSLYDANRNACAQPPNIIDLQNLFQCENQTPSLKASLRESNNRIMYTQMVIGAPISRLFFGEPYKLGGWAGPGGGTVEASPHVPVHTWTGNPKAKIATSDMGNSQFSAFDPIFHAHHSNIDRLWEVWKALAKGNHQDITDPDYLNTEFLFYDENGNLVKVKISQALNINTLR